MASIRKELLLSTPPDAVWQAFRDVGAVHTRLAPAATEGRSDVGVDEAAMRFTGKSAAQRAGEAGGITLRFACLPRRQPSSAPPSHPQEVT